MTVAVLPSINTLDAKPEWLPLVSPIILPFLRDNTKAASFIYPTPRQIAIKTKEGKMVRLELRGLASRDILSLMDHHAEELLEHCSSTPIYPASFYLSSLRSTLSLSLILIDHESRSIAGEISGRLLSTDSLPSVYLQTISLRRDLRGSGLATTLLDALLGCIDIFHERKPINNIPDTKTNSFAPFLFVNSLPPKPDRRVNLSLHLDTKNIVAKSYYHRLGLKETERINGYYTMLGDGSDAILMKGMVKFPLA